MSATNDPLGKTIRRLRLEKELSQEEFAHRAGLHRTYISQLERGLKSPTLDVFYKVSRVLSMRPSQLMIEIEKEID